MQGELHVYAVVGSNRERRLRRQRLLRDLVGLARETSTTLILDEVRVHVSCKQANPLTGLAA